VHERISEHEVKVEGRDEGEPGEWVAVAGRVGAIVVGVVARSRFVDAEVRVSDSLHECRIEVSTTLENWTVTTLEK